MKINSTFPRPFYSFSLSFSLSLSLLILGACSAQKLGQVALKKMKPTYSFTNDSIPKAPDYADSNDWFLYQSEGNEEVDVFFIHPTTYQSSRNWNQPLEDSLNTAKTIRKSIEPQALLFDSIANVYAPRYRHATFYSFFDSDSNGVQALDLALGDIRSAFEYYMANENNGKALIIASHSQGSLLGIKLLKEKRIQDLIGDRLVIAYLIGWPVLESDLKAMPYTFCQDSTQFSCIASWNAQKKNAPVSMKSYSKDQKVFSTNPLSWTTDNSYYPKTSNLGAHLLVKDTVIIKPNYVGARNFKGYLAIDKPKAKKELKIRRFYGNYHVYDIAFFYRNLQVNAALRKKVYLEDQEARK